MTEDKKKNEDKQQGFNPSNVRPGKEGDKITVPIGDKKYVIQHPGVRWYIKHTDKATDRRGNPSNEKYIDGLLDMCVIQNVSMDDFENVDHMYDLVEAIESFLGARA